MKLLCDVNVWVAMVIGDHPHNGFAQRWFDSLGEGDTAYLCRTVQQGFLRLITDGVVFKGAALSNKEALRFYRQLQTDVRVGWLDEPTGLEAHWLSYADLGTSSPKVWMDAYLAAFAVLSGARLVTFDRGFRVYRGLDWMDLSRLK